MSQQHSQQSLVDARQFFNQKAYPEALHICETLLARKGPQADILTLKALTHKQMGDFEEAGKSMDLALGQKPDNAGMLFTGALINLKLSKFDLAKNQAMKAAREAPDNPPLICQCAMLLGSVGEPQQALQILEKFTQQNQKHADDCYLIGKFHAAFAIAKL